MRAGVGVGTEVGTQGTEEWVEKREDRVILTSGRAGHSSTTGFSEVCCGGGVGSVSSAVM